MKQLFSVACIAITLTACSTSEYSSLTLPELTNTKITDSQQPNNIIMVVADGMGPAYTTAYRYFNDNPKTDYVEETVFDRHLVGMSSTYPAAVSGYVTDSAASATALATGVKSYNGAIAVDINKNPVQTVLEWAKLQGKKTGIVVTSQINHATPASYLTHNESRQNYNAIANSYIDDTIKADVMLGGGWKYFIRDDRNLVEEFRQAGVHYIDDFNALSHLPKKRAVLGLFADVGLPYSLDDKNSQRLSVMTNAAINQLENKQGYFMLVEASQVDWAGHSNDIAAAMGEMADLASTMRLLEAYVEQNPDTLVVLTADHSTGGLTVAANGKYEWQPDILRTMKMSPYAIAQALTHNDITIETTSELLNFTVTAQEVQQLQEAKYDASKYLFNYQQQKITTQRSMKKPDITKALNVAIKKLIDTKTNTGWTSGGHTAIDVPVFAFGKGSQHFIGKSDNTDIAKKLFKLLGKGE